MSYSFDIMPKPDSGKWEDLSPEKRQLILNTYNKMNNDLFEGRHPSKINPKEVYTFSDHKRSYYFQQLYTEDWLRRNGALIDNSITCLS